MKKHYNLHFWLYYLIALHLANSTTILAAVTKDDRCYFSPRHVCDALGIDWMTQFRKIKADEVLARVVGEMPMTARDGKNYITLMLPIEFLSGWLFTIKKVRPEVQDKLNVFRAEGFVALDAWFRKGMGVVNAMEYQSVANSTSMYFSTLYSIAFATPLRFICDLQRRNLPTCQSSARQIHAHPATS